MNDTIAIHTPTMMIFLIPIISILFDVAINILRIFIATVYTIKNSEYPFMKGKYLSFAHAQFVFSNLSTYVYVKHANIIGINKEKIILYITPTTTSSSDNSIKARYLKHGCAHKQKTT